MLKNRVLGHSNIQICDLSFIEQIFIWSLRMKVRGDRYFAKVTSHCEENLSPAASHIALNSIEMIVKSVQNYGVKSLSLNCTCMRALSSDEWLLITLFRKANDGQIQAALSCAASMVKEEGVNWLLHAILSFQMAMEPIGNPIATKTNHALMVEQTQHGALSQTSKMIH